MKCIILILLIGLSFLEIITLSFFNNNLKKQLYEKKHGDYMLGIVFFDLL